MTTKFVDTFEGIVSLKANVQKSKTVVASIGVQCQGATVKESDAQTDLGVDVPTQTEDFITTAALVEGDGGEAKYNWHTLNDFLLRSEPLILRTIADNRRTARIFSIYDAASALDGREAHVNLAHSLRSDNWPDGGQVMSLSWNSSGTTVGITCGRMTHDDWCTHRGFIMTWNVDRGRLNSSKADHVYETTSCCTCLAFHPTLPNLFASCTYTGDVSVWSLSDEGDPVALVQSDDQASINCVAWLPVSSSTDSPVLATGGADGRIFIWTVPSKGKLLTLTQAFQVTVANLPRVIRGKVSGENKTTGINTVMFAKPPLTSRFAVGTETGGVFQCNLEMSGKSVTNARITVPGTDKTISCYDPVVLIQKPHNGPVYKVAFHPRDSTIFASCGADGFVRIGSVFQTTPALEIDTNCGCLYDFCWSPLRSCVFACSTSTGRLVVFDLTQATDRPVLNIEASSSQERSGLLSAVAFNPRRSNIVATGDSSGYVKVWNLGDAFSSAEVGEDKLLEQLVTAAVENSTDSK